MQNLLDIIVAISTSPEIYLGRPSLERLYAFIGGYLLANPEADDNCLIGFNEFVSAKYHINTDHNWSEIIQFFSPNGDAQAFKTFVELFDEFRHKTVDSSAS